MSASKDLHYLQNYQDFSTTFEQQPWLTIQNNKAYACELIDKAQDTNRLVGRIQNPTTSALLQLLQSTCPKATATRMVEMFRTDVPIEISAVEPNPQNNQNRQLGLGGGVYSSGRVHLQWMDIQKNMGSNGGGYFANQLTGDASIGPFLSIHSNDGALKKEKDVLVGTGIGAGVVINGGANSDQVENIVLHHLHVYENGMGKQGDEMDTKGSRLGGGIVVAGPVTVEMKGTNFTNLSYLTNFNSNFN